LVRPTSSLRVACFAVDSLGHRWQNVASIGEKGTATAAKVLTVSALDPLEKPDILAVSREDFVKRTKSKKNASLISKGKRHPQDSVVVRGGARDVFSEFCRFDQNWCHLRP
jgi:hypothetical protein